MKNYRYILICFLTLFFVSCEKDYLDVVPDNLATLDLAFSNQFNAEKYLYTCYSFLPSPSNKDGNPALTAGDEIWFPEFISNSPGPLVASGFQNITTPKFNYWDNGLYIAIRTCNIFIENIDNVPGLDQYLKEQWKAEANFLKAYYHFYLLRMYGPVVINDVAVSVTASTQDVKAERNTLEEGFEYVIGLLDLAIADLPNTLQFKDEDLGRVTKPIAASIKAQVLATYASPLFNGNPVYSGFKDSKGTPLFPANYEVTKWQRAATAAKEAIDICHEAGITLYQKDDYRDPFPQSNTTLLKAALRGRITEKWNKELIWGHTGGTETIQHESMPRLYSYVTNPVASRHAPTLKVAEMYYSENGVPIGEDINYDYLNRYKHRVSGTADRYHVEPGQETAILNFNRETRFYADLAFDRGVWFGNGSEKDTNPWYIHNRSGEFASIFQINFYSVTGYWPKKLVSINTTVRNGTTFNADRYAFPIIRLADLYLYYAEALNEVKGAPDSEVYEYIDKVRERAGLSGVVESWTNYSNNPTKPKGKSGMRDIIQQERMIELAFEGPRFWDLRRWKLAEKYLNQPVRGWSVTEKDVDDYYTVRVIHNQRFFQKDYLWPISEGEIINNPNLTQNPGW